jgi:hypothetical protein
LAMRAESEAELGQAPWRRDELEGAGRGELMRMRWWPGAGAWELSELRSEDQRKRSRLSEARRRRANGGGDGIDQVTGRL